MIVRALFLALTVLTPLAAWAQTEASAPPPACPEKPVIAEPWTSWTQSGMAVAGHDGAGAPSLILGKPVSATLHPVAHVQFAADPARAPDAKSYAGLFRLSLKAPARVGIALSAGAWVDVVTGKALAPSVEHGHGATCSGIRKIVWFALPAGTHLVQIANAGAETIRVMAADEHANQPMAGHPMP
ncbi:hypothetical protein [Sphingobium aquiterrae]|uniref:hypothetical protein n=1 Tax=Sphingobium aquiterrae TaxID=2038656 RepID=UPI0030187E06